MSQNVTHIIHKDRHGNVKEDRPFSVPLTSDEGESQSLAMSQKAVTDIANELREQIGGEGGGSIRDAIDELQDQIDAIVGDKATVSLTASESTLYVGETKNITVTANASMEASEIVIKKNGSVIASDTNKASLTIIDGVSNPSANIVYTVEATIKGSTKTASKTVAVVGKIYYGAGATEAAAVTVAPKRTSPAGTYNVTVAENLSSVFFLIPADMSINSATMSGFDFYFKSPTTITKDDTQYKCYQSEETYDAGTLEIVIK